MPTLLHAVDQDAQVRPNVLLIMVDDMGFSDVGCYGGEIHTPNIDRLARRGVRFTQFYNNAKCSPSRNSLLSGHYAGWHGEDMEQVNLALEMRAAGYRTYMTGKVHGHSLGGFDRSCTMGACASFWDLVHPKGKMFVET
ncbi:MAG: sulfatase-like hydrolase/transferase, partial [Candidatus Sumerlaeota bacterium]